VNVITAEEVSTEGDETSKSVCALRDEIEQRFILASNANPVKQWRIFTKTILWQKR
jgi:hypothetical protein